MRTHFLLHPCFLLFMYLPVSAQVAGPNNANSFSNGFLPGHSQSWTNLNMVQYEDETYAAFGNLPGIAGSHTDYLKATDFGFGIPAGTIIDGIKVEVKCSDVNSRTSDYSIRLVKAGSITTTEKATGTPYPASNGYMSYGGPTDLWGETWDYKFIDDNNFGVVISAQRNSYDNVVTAGIVDHIRITVYYTFITLPVNITGFTATAQNKSVQLKWGTIAENNISNYSLERSADASNFTRLYNVPALNTPLANYEYIDKNPLPGISYYRLHIAGLNGNSRHSKIISVKLDSEKNLSLFPSPWNRSADLHINNDNNQQLIIYFFNEGGQVISTVTTHSKKVPTESLGILKGLTSYKIYNSRLVFLGSGRIVVL